MANENGVNVQEKANDVEMIELSDDEQADVSKVSSVNDVSSSVDDADKDAAHEKADDDDNVNSDFQQVDEDISQDEKVSSDSAEKDNIDESINNSGEEAESVEPSSEIEVPCNENDSEVKKEEEEEFNDARDSTNSDKDPEIKDELSQDTTADSVIESKTSSVNDIKEEKSNIEMITIESEDEKCEEVQDLSTKKVIEEKKPENENVLPIEIPDEVTGFPSFFKDVIEIGITFSINRKNRNNLEIDDQSSVLDCPSQIVPLVLKKMNKFPKKLDKDKASAPPKPSASNQKNMLTIPDYYSSAAGKFLMGIGLSKVKQHYHRDIISKIKKQIRKEGEAEDLMEELKKQQEYYSLVRAANSPYQATLEKCEHCDFKTEFKSVMFQHLLYPHMTSRKEYKCNHCQYSCRDPKVIFTHYQSLHQMTCLFEPSMQLSQYCCPICSFETGVKTKATGHITRCLKTYSPDKLLLIKEDVYPAITPKPITREDIKIYEATLQALRFSNQKMMPGANSGGVQSTPRSNNKKTIRQPVPPNPANILNRLAPGLPQNNPIPNPAVAPVPPNPLGKTTSLSNIDLKNLSPQIIQMLTSNSQFVNAAAKLLPPQMALNNNQLLRGNAGLANLLNMNLAGLNPQQNPLATLRPQIPLQSKKPKQMPPQQQPQPVQTPQVPQNAHNLSGESNNVPPSDTNDQLVMCEICDGYIKDVDNLRTHMHWIHKVKIHPKMLQNRPPLNCQKCQWRFFTDQGLERHLLGSHGLVTTNMQELVGQGKDGGRCTICGRVYNSKLVSHMSMYHKMNLKPAHLSYKCTVCSATFNLYRLFESHVYLVHSNGSTKRNSSACDSSTAGESAPKKKIARLENGN